ncbi:MAG: hypothetical protein H6767_03505 [Candidatus Peribacteria bacterium]|nr:MAG: hypothetical protein H6767_03505 [Candidatus Peribacteria bacterium]
MQKHFDPFLDAYDLSNLNQREFYCKLLVRGQVKDPFSLKSVYVEDSEVPKDYVQELYSISRQQHNRSLEEAKQEVIKEQKDVVERISDFSEPII